MDDPGARRAAAPSGAPRWLRSPRVAGTLVALMGLGIAAAVVVVEAADVEAEVTAQLDRIATDIDRQVNRRVDVARSALMTMGAQVSSGVASPREVQRVLGDTGVVEDVPGLLAMVHAQASADGDRVTARAVHPLTPNVAVLGRNILRDPERRRAIEAARDSGVTTATSVVTHVDGGVDAILVVHPVYERPSTTVQERRDSFHGVMIGVLSPQGLFAGVERLPVVATVTDIGPTATGQGGPVTLWSSGDMVPASAMARELEVADRTWELRMAPAAGFPVTSTVPVVAGVAGTLLALLLGALTAVLVGRRDRLAQLVAERTRDLEQANRDLESVNADLERAGRLRSQFITTVSHELRTPLTSVLGFIQTVRRIGDENADVRDDFLSRAERNGLLLRRMIEELLDFGRLERGEVALDRSRLDLGRTVADMVRDVRPALDGRDIEVTAEVGAEASVDRDALERIVANLISNAVHHAPDAGPIELVVRRCDDWVELVCRDRGPGFVERDLPVLFERFVRGTGVMGEGTGIGLALVRELAVAHGGDADLANRPGGGAEVLVRLPALGVVDRAPATTAAGPEPFERAVTGD